jgi:TrmH family RNA methyltransferase
MIAAGPSRVFSAWLEESWRQRAGEFLVQGVRPISLAIEFGWPVRAVIYDAARSLSRWAAEIVQVVDGELVAMASELLRQLGGKDEDVPELVLVVELPDDDLSRIAAGPSFLGVVLDRPNSPGNIGMTARSLDAFGGGGLIVTGTPPTRTIPERCAPPPDRCWWCRWSGLALTGRYTRG